MKNTPTQVAASQSYLVPLLLIGILFFVFGFVTWVNGVLIAFFKKSFQLTDIQSYLVTFAFFISYTLMAIPGSAILRRTGFKNGMSLGLGVMAVGTFIFIPAANSVSYPFFLGGLFIIGIGLTLLQTASNPYVTILGPRESAAQRISFLGIMNKVAGIVGLEILGGVLLKENSSLNDVVVPYAILTGAFILMALLTRLANLPEVSEEQEMAENLTTEKSSVFAFPNLVLGVIAMFVYVGAEVIAADTIILYGKELGFEENISKRFPQITLVGMLVGYVLGIVLIPKFISQQLFLRISAVSGIFFAILAIFTKSMISVYCIGLLGLSNAIMWPAIWPLAINGLGKFTKIGSALLIMGIAGGAILPLLYGYTAEIIASRQIAYLVVIPLYMYILYYAVVGHKKINW
ncbi:MAG: sugar MFS transporter [Verrucomicrobia bacterium]|nr:sugar MFS transporter [Cytophagales bacterium]